MARHLPSFVINHGVVTPVEVQKLLNESMVSKALVWGVFLVLRGRGGLQGSILAELLHVLKARASGAPHLRKFGRSAFRLA